MATAVMGYNLRLMKILSSHMQNNYARQKLRRSRLPLWVQRQSKQDNTDRCATWIYLLYLRARSFFGVILVHESIILNMRKEAHQCKNRCSLNHTDSLIVKIGLHTRWLTQLSSSWSDRIARNARRAIKYGAPGIRTAGYLSQNRNLRQGMKHHNFSGIYCLDWPIKLHFPHSIPDKMASAWGTCVVHATRYL